MNLACKHVYSDGADISWHPISTGSLLDMSCKCHGWEDWLDSKNFIVNIYNHSCNYGIVSCGCENNNYIILVSFYFLQ